MRGVLRRRLHRTRVNSIICAQLMRRMTARLKRPLRHSPQSIGPARPRLKSRSITSRMTAPSRAVTSEPIMPPPMCRPRTPPTQPPMNAPTIPTMMNGEPRSSRREKNLFQTGFVGGVGTGDALFCSSTRSTSTSVPRTVSLMVCVCSVASFPTTTSSTTR